MSDSSEESLAAQSSETAPDPASEAAADEQVAFTSDADDSGNQSLESPAAESATTNADKSAAAGSTAGGSQADPSTAARPAGGGGPLSLDKIRELRRQQQSGAAQRGPRPDRAAQGAPQATAPSDSDQASGPREQDTPAARSDQQTGDKPQGSKHAGDRSQPRRGGKPRREGTVIPTPEPTETRSKIAVPSRRQPLPSDLEDELASALGGSDLDKLLVGDSMLQVGHELTEGQRLQGKVMKAQGEFVFLSLGGPNEGVIPALQFEELPTEGKSLDVIVRGFLADEGLYELTLPGNTVDVSDWSDLNEGEVVEAVVTAANAGGLECKVGNIQGFIPASQASEYRIETLADMVGQKLLCVVTEANPRRGNLVLSHRAVLEREKKEKRAERLASLEIGSAVEGVVRKILDFGAFVDLGGVDGLLHVSQLSWERVNHPSEILEEGQKIQVRVDKLDEQTGKISLSYRSLQDHPWDDIDARFPVGSLVSGTVTRIAEFGAFVRVATGVEGLVHVSELAHHRVPNVASVVQEGQEVQVKVLAVDAEQQRMSLSLKAALAAPEPTPPETAESETETEEPRPEPILPKHRGPLKGGTGRSDSAGEQFGLKW